MKSSLWINRAAGLACVVLAGVAVTSAAAIAEDILAVRQATDAVQPSPRPAGAAPRAPNGLKPLLRQGAAAPGVAINEYLNGKLGEVGLNVVSAEMVSLKPLGSGLKLAEIRVEANGDALAAATVANWVSVNREAVRMTSMSISTDLNGDPRCSLVLLAVIA